MNKTPSVVIIDKKNDLIVVSHFSPKTETIGRNIMYAYVILIRLSYDKPIFINA